MPQGIPLDPKNRGRARVKIAVFFVLAVHGIGLMALLMQGCRREEAPPVPPVDMVDTNQAAAPSLDDTNLPPVVDTNSMAAPVSPVVEPTPPMADTNTAAQGMPTEPVVSAVPGADYKVAKGDSFYTIGKKFGVTSKAIAEANPTVNPNRLQIGQTLVIPPPTAAPSSAAPAVSGGAEGTVYTVKSGDNLTKISQQFGVSIKAIRSANNLVTDRITVGQKLTIPARNGN